MNTPPRLSSWILTTALPNADGDAIAGDLCEEFREHIVPTRGVRFARWWYRWQVARSLAPLFFRSWQRASIRRASTAIVSAAIAATVPTASLLMLRTFVLQQVPLKTTPELSGTFAMLLGAFVVVTCLCAVGVAARILHPQNGDRNRGQVTGDRF